MNLARSSEGPALTRREFLPRLTTAVLGAGVLLHSPTLWGGASAAPVPATGSGPMGRRILGKTGISVSELGFGCHASRPNMKDFQAREAHIRKGLELGVNLFDIHEHLDIYEASYSHLELMSQVLAPVRQEVVVSFITVWPARQTLAEVENTLEVFNTDVIDLYRIYVDELTPSSEVEIRFEALQQAKQEGKIRAVGLVGHEHEVLAEVLQTYPEVDYLMLPYNFEHQLFSPVISFAPTSWGEVKERGGMAPSAKGVAEDPDCPYYSCVDSGLPTLVREHGVGVIAMKPFAAGALLKLGDGDPLLKRLRRDGVSLPRAALRFVMAPPEIASAIPAMNSIDEVMENAGAMQGSGLSAEEAECLQIGVVAAGRSGGAYLPEGYRWLEKWKV